MTWKFAIDYDALPDYTEAEIRDMVAEKATEADGRIFGDKVYITKFEDAFSFRLRAGHLLEAGIA